MLQKRSTPTDRCVVERDFDSSSGAPIHPPCCRIARGAAARWFTAEFEWASLITCRKREYGEAMCYCGGMTAISLPADLEAWARAEFRLGAPRA